MNRDTAIRLHNLRMDNESVRYDMDEQRPRFDRMAHRHENGTAPRAVSAYQLFQTPKRVAEQLVATLDLKPGMRILEPSAGLGRILDALEPHKPSEVVAVEIAQQCAGELFAQNRERVTLLQRDFLMVQPEEIGLFDAVAMNPPFHLRSDLRHIEHALKFLKPGGRLASVVLNAPNRQAAIGGRVARWIDLPDRSFKESNTNVPTAIVVF